MTVENLPKNKEIILFDGICNLCNSLVQYVVQKDKNDLFRFVALQSELGQNILNYIGVDPKNIDSVVLYQPGKAYYLKSNAALQIANKLGGVFTFATIFRIIPSGIRNLIYDFVAKNRYKWFGKNQNCLVPTAALKDKFLT